MYLNRQMEIENFSTIIIATLTGKIYIVVIDSFCKAIRLDIPFLNSKGETELKGSCNGLLCLTHRPPRTNRYDVYLWNLATADFKQLPALDNSIDRGRPVLRFGYDQISGFKVLAVRSIGLRKFEAIVYTLGISSWRDIGELQYPLLNKKSQVYGGCPHWIVGNGNLKSIISFSVGNEKFKEIPMPPTDNFTTVTNLTALGGHLSIFYSLLTPRCYELWVRMDDGLENPTWTKQLSINKSDIPQDICGSRSWVSGIWGFKNGQILLWGQGRRALFNPLNGEVRALNLPGKPYHFEVYSYIEGLGMLTVEDRDDVQHNS